jgi:purine-binding chemotaxis protein CheW
MAFVDKETTPIPWLLCRLGTRLCALRLADVAETMRVLPIEPLVGAPRFVCGLCMIRGSPIPVVEAGPLLDEKTEPRRLVTLAVGSRRVALAVDSVLGVRIIAAAAISELPPLLQGAAGDVVSAIGTLDAELLFVLSAARLATHALLAEAMPEVSVR